jgi:hypothetical protein
MKLISALPFLGGALAGWDQMKRDFDLLKAQAANSTDRNVETIIGDVQFEQFDQYGCWCYFHSDGSMQGALNDRKGRGKPIDIMDSFCRDLTWGYDCLLMETESNDLVMASALDPANNLQPCVPWEVFYISGIGNGRDLLNQICDLVNTGLNSECARAACKIEGLFVLDLFTIVGLDDGIDPQYHADNGFVLEDNCPTIQGGGPATRMCCGAYPFRKPFHMRNGVNACCTDNAEFTHIFQPLTHTCCTTHVVEVGTDCN